MQLSPHFTLSELTKSSLAKRHGIDNLPKSCEIVNLKRLAVQILEPVRLHYNIPFSPSSGFRCLAVNRLAGSGDGSQHVQGEAADFELPGIANMDLALWIKSNLVVDQLILEFHNVDDPSSGWIHCSYVKQGNRNQCLIYDGHKYKEF